ncbi:phosphate/phosphite/phosphonate ABC transporter substrate-binding protein [Jiella avicenniae]|uniref:PhnD/SsuA/transferrin family substrate-binding protein n=1 Tax=Jiella avicenniae TaxID=2907202 RepID=A0A9X1P5D1_9HYPH|nr:PhnD/SsuA/transferrin family substrate-binding protein [Jiella avicenniae]MCE7030124.1 PhnD/SsuA/transferrin family substrate-binding protein [Jiella avicenniae]
MTRIASLGMYDMPWLHAANDAVWAGLAARLRDAGMADVPETLDRTQPLAEIWHDPALLFAQTCGYPLVTALKDVVTPIAAPVYSVPGCAGASHCSVIVVATGSSFETLADLRGRRAAINGRDSNSGMNLFRHAVVPLARGGRFFGEVVITGGHLASLDHVATGKAEVAAIDCVTFGLVRRHRPELVEGVRVIGETAKSPALPFVTRGSASRDEIGMLFSVLRETIADPDLASAVEALGLSGVASVSVGDYAVVLGSEREAVAAGYPILR